MTKKHPSEIVLRALRHGLQVKDMVMSEDGEVATVLQDGCVVIPWDINDFIKWCEKIPEEDIIAIAGSLALQHLRKERY